MGLSAVLLVLPGFAESASDPTMTSSSYSAVETQIGGNGQFNSSSANYSINPNTDDGGSSLGESAVGNSSSANYQTNAGFNTTAQPGLTLVINSSSVSLGNLTTGAASYATSTFDVTDYTSYGYTVQVVGTPPQYGTHTLTALTTDTASAAGTEQFGINTVQNTVAGQGANPLYVPDNVSYPSVSKFSFGVAGDGATGTYGSSRPYTISDKFRFNSGDTIASSPKTSGDTRFTITYLANIAALTPAGKYTGNLSLVATGQF